MGEGIRTQKEIIPRRGLQKGHHPIMLKAIVIMVRPEEKATAPPFLGRAVQAWFLNLVRAHDAGLSASIHEGGGLRPYTVSGLIGAGSVYDNRKMLSPDRVGWLRITTLTPNLSALLIDRIEPMLQGARLDLEGALLRVEGVAASSDEHPWAGETTPQALVASGALDPEMERRVTLRFVSPTTFKSENANLPFPLPDMVFGSLINKWNAFSPITLHPDARRFADARVVASKYRLQTQYVKFGPDGRGGVVGCTGECRYIVRGNDRYWRGVIRTLAGYAFFAGVGARTSIGLGQAALWDERGRRPILPDEDRV